MSKSLTTKNNMADKKEIVTSKEEEMMTIYIDPKRTNGGLRTNFNKLYVGKKTLPVELAEDLLRRQEEYAATVSKLTDPSIKLKNQSIEQSRKFFIADPVQHGNNPKFSKVYGMLDPFQLESISELDLEEWKDERMGLFNY